MLSVECFKVFLAFFFLCFSRKAPMVIINLDFFLAALVGGKLLNLRTS